MTNTITVRRVDFNARLRDITPNGTPFTIISQACGEGVHATLPTASSLTYDRVYGFLKSYRPAFNYQYNPISSRRGLFLAVHGQGDASPRMPLRDGPPFTSGEVLLFCLISDPAVLTDARRLEQLIMNIRELFDIRCAICPAWISKY